MQKKIAIILWVPVSKTCSKTNIYLKVRSFFVTIYRKMEAKLSARLVQIAFYLADFFFTNIRYLFLFICVIYTKGNETVANWDYPNVCLTINDPVKSYLLVFSVFIVPILKRLSIEKFLRKILYIFTFITHIYL